MIGQVNLINTLEELKRTKSLARFSVLVGPKGSGRKTVIKKVFADLPIVFAGTGIDNIREVIKTAYSVKTKTLYVISDADNMSVPAKNALLKVIEEPPNNAYFIMTLENEYSTLQTIRSRGVIIYMDRYTTSEIDAFTAITGVQEEEIQQMIHDLCDTPGDVLRLVEMNVFDFYNYVQKVVDNIAKVSGANAFKIADKIALKNEEDKYDLKMFWKAFIKVCVLRGLRTKEGMYFKVVPFTGDCIKDLKVTGVNKQMLFDKWLLGVRKEWMLQD